MSKKVPGEHTVEVSFDGFAPYKKTVVVPSSGKTEHVVVLVPNSSVGDLWLKQHPKEQKIREGLGSKASSQISKDLVHQIPIASELPHVDNLFRVDISDLKNNDPYDNTFALKVEYYGDEGQQQAREWLKFKKVPKSTTVYYIDALSKR